MLKKISNKLKKTGLIFLGILIPFMPTTVQAQEATVPTQESSIIEGRLGINYGKKEQTLMGKDFSKGNTVEINGEARIKLNEKGGLKLDGLVRSEKLDYVDGNGSLKNHFVDANLTLEQYATFSNCTTKLGFGVNFDLNKSEQTYEGIKVKIQNITAGPVITGNIDSDYIDFNILIGSGFGKAGNDVQGSALGIKPKLRIGLDFDLRKLNVPLRLENYAEIEITLVKTENIDRNVYNAEVGTMIDYQFSKNISAGLGYVHSWHYGDKDNVQGSTVKTGLKFKF